MTKVDLKACLDGYLEAGQLDSSGEFTLSKEHAENKLKDFRLPHPRLYVLNLVSAVVAAEATHANFETDADDLILESDAALADVRDLEDFHSLVFRESSPVPLKELAVALNGLLALKPKHVELQVCDGKRGAQLTLKGKGYEYEASDLGETPFLRLKVRERFGLRVTRKFAARTVGGVLADSEEDAIFRYCNRAPCKITVNGDAANRPLIKGDVAYALFSNRSIPSNHLFHGLGKPHSTEVRCTGFLANGGRLAPWVTLVNNGVNFRLPEQAFGRSSLRGVVYVDGLRKDLSQVQLVQDATFQRVIDEISKFAMKISR